MTCYRYLLLVALCACITRLPAQKLLADTVGVNVTPMPKADPKKATLLSLVPGGGQIYNKKYWKVPVIYAGFGLLTYSFIFYNNEYSKVRTAYRQKINGEPVTDPEFANVPEEVLLRTRESYGKSRDASVIGMAGLYVLNLLDAAVDAHLKGFDVSDKLSLRIRPGYDYSNGFASVRLHVNLYAR